MKNWMKLVIIAVLIPVFLYLLPTTLGGDTEFLIVHGNSMLPTIVPGSFVITKAGQPYEIGEIVSFPLVQEGHVTIVVHRIIAEEERGFTIQGDNNEKSDRGFHTEEDIRGRVIFATPIVGNLLEMARNPIFLIITAVSIVIVQMAQKSRKQKREKLRRIRMGLPKPSPNLNNQSKINQKKPDYTLFYGAIGFNVLLFIITQIMIVYNAKPKGDMLTGFLFNILGPFLASILILGLYLIFIIFLYKKAKSSEKKFFKRKAKVTKKMSTMQLLLGQNAIPMVTIAQFLWMLFILLSLFHLIDLSGDLFFKLTCDPATNLDCR